LRSLTLGKAQGASLYDRLDDSKPVKD